MGRHYDWYHSRDEGSLVGGSEVKEKGLRSRGPAS